MAIVVEMPIRKSKEQKSQTGFRLLRPIIRNILKQKFLTWNVQIVLSCHKTEEQKRPETAKFEVLGPFKDWEPCDVCRDL